MWIDHQSHAELSPLMRGYVDVYTEIADYDTATDQPGFQQLEDLEAKALKDAAFIGRVEGLQILEIGPGLGHLAKTLEARGASVSLADLVPHYMERLASSVSGDCYLADIQSGAWTQAFDLVVMCDVLEHVFRPGDALLSAYDALRPGGRLYLRSPANESLIGHATRLGIPYEVIHLRTYTKSLLKREVLASGFSLVKGPRAVGNGRQPRSSAAGGWYWNVVRSGLMEHFNVPPSDVPRNVSRLHKLGKHVIEGSAVPGHKLLTHAVSVSSKLTSTRGEVAVLARRRS